MRIILFFGLAIVCSVSLAKTNQKELYKLSMENDAQFIEAVGDLFNALAFLQRTITSDLKWENKNSEYKKIKKSIKFFKSSSMHLKLALDNSDLLLTKLDKEKKEKFDKQLKGFKSQIGDLDGRVKVINKKLENKQFPERAYIHKTINLALNGIGFGMSVAKAKKDPGKSN